jgi:hypothetical protein
MHMTMPVGRAIPSSSRGQALALFALFLLVLMGAAALGVDYANWLLTDRQLQNVADHAALAGAAQFSSDFTASSCGASPGSTQCVNARSQAWESISQELGLNLQGPDITSLASRDSPAAGDKTVGTVTFNRTIWVSTPPPLNTGGHNEYKQVGGLYAGSFGIMFVRVDQPTRTFLGGVFGINVRDRIGWATAGILPTDFALSVFCRNSVAPESGVCADGGTSLGIDGGGGITLTRGDIGSSNSLKVTQQTGQGAILKAGNVFLENGTCGSSSWTCPPATLGGISDGSGTAKNAFYIPPIPVPQYALPTGAGTLPWNDGPTTTCSSTSACIPGTGAAPNYATPIDWSCVIGTGSGACGTPVVTTVAGVSTVTCTSHGAATQHMTPKADTTVSPASTSWNGTVSGGNIYPSINESSVDPTGSLGTPPTLPVVLTGPASSFAYSKDGVTNAQYRVSLTSPNGTLQSPGLVYLRWVLSKVMKSGGNEVVDNGGGAVTVTAQLQENVSGTWVNRGTADTETATSTITAYQGENSSGNPVGYTDVTTIGNPNALSILFTVTNASTDHGAAISWAEAYIDQPPVPPPPPTIPAGLYRSIVIPDGGCAVLDPTGYYQGGLKQYQVPGVYYFEDAAGGGQNATISLGAGSVLIGDGVSLVFDSNWPVPAGSGGQSGAHGIEMAANAALVLNTAVSGYNPSTPLTALPSDGLAAAWQINPASTTSGVSTWGGACVTSDPCVVERSAYGPTTDWRGVTFYFKPKTNGSTNSTAYSILGRFAMSGGVAGLAFRGIMYAPYDDVQMSGANGFDTVGMVLAWSAKFNGGSAAINLDFPFTRLAAAPYLLEPSISQ